MAVTIGTDSGFVDSAPSGDPGSLGYPTIDYFAFACKDTSPVGTNKITEVGWWCQTDIDATDAPTNWEMAWFSHDAVNDRPNVQIDIDDSNTLGEGDGWKR